jgi:hypothetical protein
MDQLRRDAHAIARAKHRAVDHAVDLQFSSDLRQRRPRPFVPHDRRARNHPQCADLREGGDQRIRHSVDEILLFGIRCDVGEREHRNRGNMPGR